MRNKHLESAYFPASDQAATHRSNSYQNLIRPYPTNQVLTCRTGCPMANESLASTIGQATLWKGTILRKLSFISCPIIARNNLEASVPTLGQRTCRMPLKSSRCLHHLASIENNRPIMFDRLPSLDAGPPESKSLLAPLIRRRSHRSCNLIMGDRQALFPCHQIAAAPGTSKTRNNFFTK